jgi:PAS domain S-box-containing protein
MKDSYKILLVDDSESDRGICRRYLLTDENFDYQILEAENLAEGLELWRSQSPDLVLTDFDLPDGNGLELLQAIQKIEPVKKIPVILMTGQGDERLAVQAMKLGASDYLVKDDMTASTLCHYVETAIAEWNLSGGLTELQQFNQELQARLEERTQKLQASEAFNRSILETLPDLLLHIGRDGTCLNYIEPKVGKERFQLIGNHIAEFLSPDLLARQLQAIEQALVTRELQVYEHQILKNGQPAYEEIRILAIDSQTVLAIIRDISDRKQTELKLQQSEEINRTILATIPDLIIHMDAQGNYLLKSKGQGVRVIGLEDSSLQLKVENILPSYLAQQQLYFTNLALETGTLQIFEQIVNFPDEQRFEEVRIAPLNQQEVLIMIRDISDRKIMEKNLEESRDKFQRLVDEMGEKFVVFSHSGEEGDGIVNYVSDGIYSVFGFSKEDVFGKHWADVVNWLPEELPKAQTRLMSMAQGEQDFCQSEMRFIHPDGSIRTLQVSEHPVKNETGKFLAIEGIIEDISDRKAIEKNLEESRDKFQRLVDEMGEKFVVFSHNVVFSHSGVEETVNYVSDGVYPIFGFVKEDILGKHWADVVNWLPEELPKAETRLMSMLQGEQDFCQSEMRFIHPDGSIRTLQVSEHPVRNEAGEMIAIEGIVEDISDRKLAEQALKQQLAAIEAAIDGIAILQNNEYIYLNQSHLEICGYGHPDELLGKSWTELYSLEEITRFEQDILPVLQRDRSWRGEAIATRKDGSTFVEELSLTITEEGLLICVCRDISDRKQTELEKQQLLQELSAFKLALDQSAIVAITDVKGVITYANDLFCEISGYSRAELIGQTHRIVNSGYHPDYFFQNLWRAIRGGEIWRGEICNRKKNGDLYWMVTTLVPFLDDKGKPFQYLAIRFDITSRKQAEQQLQNLTNRLKIALNSGAIGCWEWEIVNNIVTWDERMYELYGIPVGTTVVFETFVNSLYPDDRQVTLTLVQEAVAGKAEYDMEFRVIHPDGSIHFLKCYGVVVRDDQGNPLRIIGVNFEITAQKQSEQTIRQQIEKETLLRQITQHIRDSLDLQTIFDTACQEIREFIQVDRVGIFRFYLESGYNNGEFVAESVKEGLSSVLSIPIHDHCFGADYAQRYTQGHFQAVNDVLQSDLQDCHKAVLTQFQIRANLVIPLLLGEELWGLLCIHTCDSPRIWQADEIDLIQQIAGQLAIAIQQGDLYNQIHAELITRHLAEEKILLELRRKQLLGEIIQSVRDSLDITEILVNVTQKTLEILHCDRVIVFQLFPDGKSKITEESVSDQFASLKNLHWEDEVWSQEVLDSYWQGIPRIVPDVMNDRWIDCLVEYSTQGQIQSKIVAPILQEARNQEDHRWISSDKKDRLWGVLVVHSCGKKRVWQDEEAEIVQQIADQLAIAIQQADLFNRLKQKQEKLTQTNEALALSNEDLARATRLKDEFLANMSHELRTPLTAILGMSESLQENIFGEINPSQEKAIQLIEKSGEHLLTLINDILDLSKIEAGQLELEFSSASIQYLCENSIMFVKQMAFSKNIELQTRIAENIDPIRVDELRIRQALINLLSNAIKFTPQGGKVTLAVELEGEEILFSVTDTGIGISPENLDKLFQPFVQIDSRLNRQYAGTGLGLVLVKRIITKHGGRVVVTSRAGEGSCFAFRLPYVPSPREFAPERLDTSSPSTSGINVPLTVSPLILLADDNEANRQTLEDYLSNKGYRMLLAYNGREALEMVKAHQPDLILMDIQMPEMDGLEATSLIRSDPAIAHIPIIALTALALPGDVDQCLAAGCDEYLAKPVRFKLLIETIQKFCQK